MINVISESFKFEILRLFKIYVEFYDIGVCNWIMEVNLGLVRKEVYYWMV